MNFVKVSCLIAQDQCLTNLQVAMVSQFAIKASWCWLHFPRCKAVAPTHVTFL